LNLVPANSMSCDASTTFTTSRADYLLVVTRANAYSSNDPGQPGWAVKTSSTRIASRRSHSRVRAIIPTKASLAVSQGRFSYGWLVSACWARDWAVSTLRAEVASRAICTIGIASALITVVASWTEAIWFRQIRC